MTVIGVAGCTALIVAGFGLKDSITVIADRQFGEIAKYDQIYAMSESGTADKKSYLMSQFKNDERFDEVMLGYQGWADSNIDSKKMLDFYVVVGEDYDVFKKMFNLRNRITHEKIDLTGNGAVISERMSSVLNVKIGDNLKFNVNNKTYTCKISGITENYAQNYLYMSKEYYEDVTGEEPKYNIVFTSLNDQYKDIENDISKDWMQNDDIVTVSLISTQIDTVNDTLNSLNFIVFVMILCAGLLAVVVLYNLTNINIAERTREIATIKVLGFYNLEAANYVYRENIILTIVGGIVGLFLGSLFSGFVVESIQMNMVMFPKEVAPISYLYGFILTFVFAMLVNFIMYFKMKKISMVESLKSID